MKRFLATILSTCALLGLGLPAAGQNKKKDQPKQYSSAWELIRGEHDKNKDGSVSEKEYRRGKERFSRLDRNKDGSLTAADFEQSSRRGRGRRMGRRGNRAGRPQPPSRGAVAPDFTLKTKDGKSSVTLSSLKGKKPVALIFGSYT